MGKIRVVMWGSFTSKTYETTAEEGGHVAAIRRCIAFLSGRLGEAILKDARLFKEGIHPSMSPLGEDRLGGCPASDRAHPERG